MNSANGGHTTSAIPNKTIMPNPISNSLKSSPIVRLYPISRNRLRRVFFRTDQVFNPFDRSEHLWAGGKILFAACDSEKLSCSLIRQSSPQAPHEEGQLLVGWSGIGEHSLFAAPIES